MGVPCFWPLATVQLSLASIYLSMYLSADSICLFACLSLFILNDQSFSIFKYLSPFKSPHLSLSLSIYIYIYIYMYIYIYIYIYDGCPLGFERDHFLCLLIYIYIYIYIYVCMYIYIYIYKNCLFVSNYQFVKLYSYHSVFISIYLSICYQDSHKGGAYKIIEIEAAFTKIVFLELNTWFSLVDAPLWYGVNLRRRICFTFCWIEFSV